ncbi:hypothetical protein KVP40.0219 [Vibrio phage KVP40]|uniref:Uncharacterized protein n=2 Tax=Schizotequatrovirus KVP40 TaxID=1914019 RepID=Q6WHT5_BPKVM|nr:hypothetical protein KVP40.0219 [Vibrio phage KVP40]AAQ64288.1 hypothetical protein KVP40.0219 [Vibrio phage KVP40]AFN37449.1 hypothetical protein pp2_216 [Vibrio phage phi-pp2]
MNQVPDLIFHLMNDNEIITMCFIVALTLIIMHAITFKQCAVLFVSSFIHGIMTFIALFYTPMGG